MNLKSSLFSPRPLSAILISVLTSCTGQLPGSFRFLQQQQTFSSTQNVNTKIDLLWVVDNSSSMDVHQQKLRNGFQNFTTKYLLPTWDVRVAVITTDTYLANSAFSTFLSTQIPGTTGYVSSYLSALSWLSSYKNPSWDTTLVNTTTGAFPHGLTYGNLNPLWGPSYSLLKAGVHDGPITALCMEAMPYFLKGVTSCNLRDNFATNTGADHCVNPASGESSLSQCINTVENDTVRSGNPIISTQPPTGVAGDSTWIAKLAHDFIINASVGSSGSGSERGLSSVLQLLTDNEAGGSPFFRTGSLRGIIFLSDEDDQSLQIPSPLPTGFNTDWGYMCDQASLLANNGNSSKINGSSGLCCNDVNKGCRFGSIGISCPTKTVDSYTYTLGLCVDPTKLVAVSDIKSKIDTFFTNLDGNGSTNPNYFVVTITPTTGTSVQTIQGSRKTIDTGLGLIQVNEADRGDRYLQLGQLVGNGSLSLDIGSSDYSPVLDAIGQDIVSKKSTFTLTRAPTNQEQMTVTVIHLDGTTTVVTSAQYTLAGNTVTFKDSTFVLSLSSTDKISINYQPKTAY